MLLESEEPRVLRSTAERLLWVIVWLGVCVVGLGSVVALATTFAILWRWISG